MLVTIFAKLWKRLLRSLTRSQGGDESQRRANPIYLLIAFLLGYLLNWIWTPDKKPTPVLVPSVIAEASVDNEEIKSLLREQTAESKLLREAIDRYRQKSGRPTSITQVEAQLPGQGIVTPTLPDSYTFLVNDLVPVGRFERVGQEYSFLSYDLTFKSSVVMGDTSGVALATVESSGAPGELFQIPSTLTITKPPPKFFQPQLGIGGSISIPTVDPVVSVYLPLLHPSDDIDLLSPRLGVSAKHIYLGVDALGYNIGKPLPLLNDLWIYGGASIQEELKPVVTITLGSKL